MSTLKTTRSNKTVFVFVKPERFFKKRPSELAKERKLIKEKIKKND